MMEALALGDCIAKHFEITVSETFSSYMKTLFFICPVRVIVVCVLARCCRFASSVCSIHSYTTLQIPPCHLSARALSWQKKAWGKFSLPKFHVRVWLQVSGYHSAFITITPLEFSGTLTIPVPLLLDIAPQDIGLRLESNVGLNTRSTSAALTVIREPQSSTMIDMLFRSGSKAERVPAEVSSSI
jgi:hypothetical protein